MTGTENVLGSAAFARGLLLKASTEPGWYAVLGAEDSPSLMVGVSATRCPAVALRFRAYFRPGYVAPMCSDGTTEILTGDPVEPSATVDGHVMKADASSSSIVGVNVGDDVAAELDASVDVRMCLSRGGASGASGGFVSTDLKTSGCTAVAGDCVLCNPAGGAFAVTLPSGAAADTAVRVSNRSSSENAITVTPPGGQTINGAATFVSDTPRASWEFVFDGGSDWMVF